MSSSRYPSHPACSCHSHLTRLVGLIVLAVSVTPGVLSSRSSHTPCVGSLSLRYLSPLACYSHGLLTCLVLAHCSYRVGGRSTGSQVERGRSVERDNIQIRSNTRDITGLMCSSSPYHPHGAPIFLINVPLLLLAYEQSLWDRTTLSVAI